MLRVSIVPPASTYATACGLWRSATRVPHKRTYLRIAPDMSLRSPSFMILVPSDSVVSLSIGMVFPPLVIMTLPPWIT